MAPKNSCEQDTIANDHGQKVAKNGPDTDVTGALQARNIGSKENSRRPVRLNAGQGGRRAQLERVVDSIRPDLNPENARSARAHKQAFPENARENALAPAAKAKTRRKTTVPRSIGNSELANKNTLDPSYPRPLIPDAPLQEPPVPSAQTNRLGLQYGFFANRNRAAPTPEDQDKQMRSKIRSDSNTMGATTQNQTGYIPGSQCGSDVGIGTGPASLTASFQNQPEHQNTLSGDALQFNINPQDQPRHNSFAAGCGLFLSNDNVHKRNYNTNLNNFPNDFNLNVTNDYDFNFNNSNNHNYYNFNATSKPPTTFNQTQHQLLHEGWNVPDLHGGHRPSHYHDHQDSITHGLSDNTDKDNHIDGIADSDADGDKDADADDDEELYIFNIAESQVQDPALDDDINIIDEASPSEDEANALAALRTLPREIRLNNNNGSHNKNHYISDDNHDTASEGEDVLDRHRRQNRANRPPSHSTLQQALQQQGGHQGISGKAVDGDSTHSTDDNDDDDEELSSLHSKKKRAQRHSKKKHIGYKPDNLGYYPPEWATVIVKAQQHWHRHLILGRSDPFPQIDALKEAEHLLTRVIAEHLDSGELLDSEYRRTREMDKCVFNSHSGWRKKLKDLAENVVAQAYADVLSDTHETPNQLDAAELIRRKIQAMLDDNSYHIYGTDSEGRTNNMSHPALERIIIGFFYSGNKCLAALFPEDFTNSVPDHAVALVLTVIHHCLSEWIAFGFESSRREMRGSEYVNIFRAIMNAIDSIKANDYHRVKYEANKVSWARKGMDRLHHGKNSRGGAKVLVKVVLD